MTIGMVGLAVIFMLVGMMVQFRLKSKFSEYRNVSTSSGLSGKEVAEKMLRDNGMYDVQVISVRGFFSDHYAPTKKRLILVQKFMKEEMCLPRRLQHMSVAMQFSTCYSLFYANFKEQICTCYTN
jgi:Zn-dependent membrane protease YugP